MLYFCHNLAFISATILQFHFQKMDKVQVLLPDFNEELILFISGIYAFINLCFIMKKENEYICSRAMLHFTSCILHLSMWSLKAFLLRDIFLFEQALSAAGFLNNYRKCSVALDCLNSFLFDKSISFLWSGDTHHQDEKIAATVKQKLKIPVAA